MRVFPVLFLLVVPTWGLTIKVDYRFDSSGFFNNPQARAAIEAVAARWSRIIDQPLAAVNSVDDNLDRRFALKDPSTGKLIQISSAAGADTDFLVSSGAPRADQYWNGIEVEGDTYLLFVGARNLAPLALAGPMGGGTNFDPVFEEVDGLLNRGFNPDPKFGSLNVLGGVVAFDTGTDWHFNPLEVPGDGKIDFYSIALHEVGHCFGIGSTEVVEWDALITDWRYLGVNAVSAYQADNGLGAMSLPIAGIIHGRPDYHWKDGEIESMIFPYGDPNYLSTVGPGVLQEVLMSATVEFTDQVRRKEITNVEVGALKDLGWSVIDSDPPPPQVIDLQFSVSPAGHFVLEFDSQAGENYRIQTSFDASQWSDVTPSVLGQPGSTTWVSGTPGFVDPNNLSVSEPAGFFRVVKD